MKDSGGKAKTTCKLCGAPIYALSDGIEPLFCCEGCARVWDVLQGLDGESGAKYLAAARRFGIIPNEDGMKQTSREGPSPDLSAIKEQNFNLIGLDCPSCAWVAEQILLTCDGVESASVNFFTGTGKVRYDMRTLSPDALQERLLPFGYRISAAEEEGESAVSKRVTFEFIVCAVLTMNLMSLSSLRYFVSLGWLDSVPLFIQWLELFLTIPVLVLGLRRIGRRALAGFSSLSLTMDSLITVAVLAAFTLSLAALTLEREDIYFETAAGLITISLLSRMIEARLREKALSEIKNLIRASIKKVRQRDSSGKELYREIGSVKSGETAIFLAGEIIPFDGEVKEDKALISEAVLTGEPTPVTKVRGDIILAGSSVVEGELNLIVTKSYTETRLFHITESIADSLQKNEGRIRSADKIARYFAPAVILFAFSIWLLRLLYYGFDYGLSAEAWFPSVAVLAIACPCAFSLAGVSAITAASAALLKRGVLVKEPLQLESLNKVALILFDKTGTLSEGNMSVEEMIWLSESKPEYLTLIAHSEAASPHPIAHAIRLYLREKSLDALSQPPIHRAEEIPGKGRILDTDEGRFYVGAASLFDNPLTPPQASPLHTLVWFGFERKADGVFLITDRLKEDGKEAIEELIGDGFRIALISGDRREVCERVGSELGIGEVRGDLSLDDKREIVRVEKARGGAIAFVGDGTNDALAMSEADISIAVAKSSDEVLTASGFVILAGNLKLIPLLFKLGGRLSRIIHSNYLWAFSYNTLFIPVAAMGELTPLTAMILMLISSTTVLINSLRAGKI
ncbi:MAG: cation-translocating P-type ATPase [Myxococcota bacterium]